MNTTRHATKLNNITRVVLIDVSTQDYEDDAGFFIRSGAGNIKYCPVGNEDSEAITKTVTASAIFTDPEICRKVFSSGTTATGIYIGYGV
jgi:hypothetical protein